jgi:hypothetical protein
MCKSAIRLFVLALTFVVGIYTLSAWTYVSPPYVKGTHKYVPYVVSFDNKLTPLIEIELNENVSSEEMCATLAEVADRHEHDSIREYWVTEYLQIRAYLVKDGKRSYFEAGRLYRYIPATSPVRETEGKPDQFRTKFWLAKLSL